MFGLDEWLVSHQMNSITLVLVISALLGLRHATDPDHLSAMLTFRIMREHSFPARLGIAWGIGHAATVLVVGIPLIVLVATLPSALQTSLELAVGLMICGLAVWTIRNGSRTTSHAHKHAHHVLGAHEHIHIHGPLDHDHKIRTPTTAFFVGLVHGAGGSAGVVALLLGRLENTRESIAALFVVAIFSGLSMTLFSMIMYRGIDRIAPKIGARNLTIVGGLLTLVFGIWYCAASLGVVWYPF